jgi:hypothetical protein
VSRGEGELLTVPKPRAVSLLSVYLAVKPVGEADAGDRHDIIVKPHGGSIDVATESGVFTQFKIVLPRATQA